MKKLITMAVIGGLTVALVGTAITKAKADDTPVQPGSWGEGNGPMMGERPEDGMGHRGMHGGFGKGPEAMAEFFGMTADEFKAARDEGKTPATLAQEQGKTLDDLHAFMREKAIERMTERGLAQEEIESRLEKMDQHHDEMKGWCSTLN